MEMWLISAVASCSIIKKTVRRVTTGRRVTTVRRVITLVKDYRIITIIVRVGTTGLSSSFDEESRCEEV